MDTPMRPLVPLEPEPVHAIVARAAQLAPLRELLPATPLLALPQDLALALLSDSACASIAAAHGRSSVVDGFSRIALVARCCVQLSRSGPVAYIEMSRAREAAMVFRDGRVDAIHANDDGLDAPVNAALRALGVTTNAARDEREAVGLGRREAPLRR
jgi:hypothetical protein